MPDAVMLFAAGFGKRMAPLTDTQPKPLIKVAGRALLDHALALADDAEIRRIVVNTHYRGDQIAAHLAARPEIAISDEVPDILETGGGLRAALPLLGAGPVFTLNTDAIWTGPNPLTALRAAWDPERMDALVMMIAREQANGHGGTGDFVTDAGGRLTRGYGAIYAGAQILRTDGLAEIAGPVFSLNLLWDRMIARGRLFGLIHAGGWCDVGQPSSIALAEGMLARAVHA